jgi:hypothetical protein
LENRNMIAAPRQSALAVLTGILTLGPASITAPAQTNQPRPPVATPAVRVNPTIGVATNALANPLTAGASNAGQQAASANPLTTAYNAAVLSGLTNPYANTAAGYGTNGLNSLNPYGSGYGYYETETGGLLRGTADIVTGQGKWLVSLQQASLLKEQTRQAAIETRRKQYDQYVYEQKRAPSYDQARDSGYNARLLQSLTNPTEAQISSGQALNDIVADLASTEQTVPRGPAAPLSEELLRRISLTTGAGAGNTGLLKNGARLPWPSALSDERSKADRDLVDSLVSEARRQAVSGRVDEGALKELAAASRRLHQKLASDIKELAPKQYAETSRFLGQLDDAIHVLGRPDAGDYLTRKCVAEGKDVAELVRNMTAKGLRFAPAAPGDEAAYVALHRALAAYDGAKSQVVSERGR